MPIKPRCTSVFLSALQLLLVLFYIGQKGLAADLLPEKSAPYPEEKLQMLKNHLESRLGPAKTFVAWGDEGEDIAYLFGRRYGAFFAADLAGEMRVRGISEEIIQRYPSGAAMIFIGHPDYLVVHHELWHRADYLRNPNDWLYPADTSLLSQDELGFRALRKWRTEEFVYRHLTSVADSGENVSRNARRHKLYGQQGLTTSLSYIKLIRSQMNNLGVDRLPSKTFTSYATPTPSPNFVFQADTATLHVDDLMTVAGRSSGRAHVLRGFSKMIPVIGTGLVAASYGSRAYAGETISAREFGTDLTRSIVSPADIAGLIGAPLFGVAGLSSAIVADHHYGTGSVATDYFLQQNTTLNAVMTPVAKHKIQTLRDQQLWEERRTSAYTGQTWFYRRYEDLKSLLDVPQGALESLN